jgi:uncharacterized protein with PQ loop repeat
MEAASRDVLGLVAGARSAYDISWGLFGILAIGSALWLCYGIALNSVPLIATNIATLSLQLAIFALKFRYGRGERRDNESRKTR